MGTKENFPFRETKAKCNIPILEVLEGSSGGKLLSRSSPSGDISVGNLPPITAVYPHGIHIESLSSARHGIHFRGR